MIYKSLVKYFQAPVFYAINSIHQFLRSVDIHKPEHVYPYNCARKKEFIKKGISEYLSWLCFISY